MISFAKLQLEHSSSKDFFLIVEGSYLREKIGNSWCPDQSDPMVEAGLCLRNNKSQLLIQFAVLNDILFNRLTLRA